MRRLADRARSWNFAQRVVVSIAVGVALTTIGRSAETWWTPSGGWFGYVPLSGAQTSFPGPFLTRHPGLRLIMWLVLIAAWAVLSLWLFAGAGDRPPEDAGTP